MSGDSLSSIFPLPLSPFEQFTLLDDRPDYPMTFFMHCFFSGQINVEALTLSIAQAVERHPLLGCRIEFRKRRPVWVLSPNPAPSVQVVPPGAPLWSRNGDYMDLAQENGLRIWIRQSGENAEIIFQLHHACCDGIGTFQFLSDFAVFYASRTSTNGFQPRFRSLDNQRLETRYHVLNRRRIAKPPSRLKLMRAKLRDLVRFFRRSPDSMATARIKDDSAVTNSDDAGEPNILTHWLDRKTTLDLHEVAKRVDASLNDLLVRDLLVTLQDWNQEQSDQRNNRDLRVLVPTSLRSKGDQFLPAANVLGYAFITRSAREIENPDELLIGIRNSTQAILRYKLGWTFLDAITTLLRIHKFVPLGHAMLERSCFATVIQSHMGKLVQQFGRRLAVNGSASQTEQQTGLGIEMGDLVVDQILCAPPVRPSTHAALATYTFSERLIINLRCDPNLFSQAETQRFLDRFVERLKESVAG